MSQAASESVEPQPEPPIEAPAKPWSDLKAETFQLLRLAPLGVGREGVRPLYFARLGRAERHNADYSLLLLTVELPGHLLPARKNRLELWLDHHQRSASLGPETGLVLEPENRGLGQFLLAQAIIWAKSHATHYHINETMLPDIAEINARTLRDMMLSNLGFELEPQVPLAFRVKLLGTQVGRLKSDWNKDKVQLLNLLEGAAMLLQADKNLYEQSLHIDKLKQRMESFQREDNGLRFTVTCLIGLVVFQAGLLIWMATR